MTDASDQASDQADAADAAAAEARIDSTVPHSARFWNHWLGGKDNYEVDRVIAEQIAATWPGLVDVARTSRSFLHRAIRHLVEDTGMRQFLDVGTGLPTAENTHEVAQRLAPEARVVYVDNDPLVLAHARALLTSSPEGATDYLDADLRDTDRILREAARTLDLSRPVALILMGVMGHVADHGEAKVIIGRLLDGLPSGSHLVHYDGTNTSPGMVEAQDQYNSSGAVPYHVRSPQQIAGYFDGLDVLEPGIVRVTEWRPGTGHLLGGPLEVDAYGGVGRKP
ncbi:SAM-dependent methyltransferase [Streptomyces sp. 549]|uniref:SAM-dependent methyltransferase n=1 Tax=Streptomyces sp. 549 TaxID=3049076 RepID=UPI0024C2F5B0|nr:SAM-dependent methyltransferase [Streptomyces sp. 549]MDK1474795.1 SAM-dependent methyltransferase [Streptomyces sp. 549]